MPLQETQIFLKLVMAVITDGLVAMEELPDNHIDKETVVFTIYP